MIDKDINKRVRLFFKYLYNPSNQFLDKKVNVNGLFYNENWLVITAVTNLKVVLAKGIYFLLGDKSLWGPKVKYQFYLL